MALVRVVLAAVVLSVAIAVSGRSAEFFVLSDIVHPDGIDQAQYLAPLRLELEARSALGQSRTAALGSLQIRAAIQRGRESPFSTSRSYGLPAIGFSTKGQAVFRGANDVGDLLRAPSVTSSGVQQRNPVINDPRVRGSRVGSSSASGSYWIPARIDLDTMVSKIDSRVIELVTVVPGPFTAVQGPGPNFVNVDLVASPRYAGTTQTVGGNSLDYRSNGEQWHARQEFSAGAEFWGFTAGYSHRTGSDYSAANGARIPSRYQSREFNVSAGTDLTESSTLEFSYLRLDQTDLALAGQAFDIDWLVTDGFQLTYTHETSEFCDRFVIDGWFNRTRFEGNSQDKQSQFVAFANLNFVGNTDVDSSSSGYRTALVWDGTLTKGKLSMGSDLRFIDQELNEISSGNLGFNDWNDANSPIPSSYNVNPGLFIEYEHVEPLAVWRTGMRLDWNFADINASPSELQDLGIAGNTAAAFLGTSNLDQQDLLGLAFLTLDVPLTPEWKLISGIGYSERAPNLTERFAVEPFMFLIQNGANTITGDPRLEKERTVQTDLTLTKTTDNANYTVTAFHAWLHDYITFEAMSEQFDQLDLKYVNTDLATLWGVEATAGFELNRFASPFGTLRYVEGTDETRNGRFATRKANATLPTFRDYSQVRGSFSGVSGNAKEPLPGILPLESVVGVQFHPAPDDTRWGFQVAARFVATQDRVAQSLRETRTPGFTTFEWRGYWNPNDHLFLAAGVENITNKLYREHLDFRSDTFSVFRPGVTAYLSTQITY